MNLAIINWISLTIGGVCVVLAIATAFESIRLFLRGALASGTVVDYSEEEDCFCLIVEFTDHDGSSRRFTSSTGLGVRPYPEGTRVTVVYDRKHQQRAQVRAFWSLWLFPMIMSLFAALFLFGGLGVFGHD